MARTNTLGNFLTDVADAIRTKKGSSGTIQASSFDSEILSIPSGGTTIEKKDINLYDYDGTLLHSYTKTEFNNLTELPENPTHEGLTSMGWNWDLSTAKTYLTDHNYIDIGQVYQPTNDSIVMYVSIDKYTLSPYISFGINGTATIDWGDNTTSTVTGSSISTMIDTTHTYSSGGDYIIKVSSNTDIRLSAGSSSYGSKIFWGGYSSYQDNRYIYSLKKIFLNSNIVMSNDYTFYNCKYLETIILPNNSATIGAYLLAGCSSLKHLTIPKQAISMQTNLCNYCYNLQTVSISSTATKMGQNGFAGCYSLERLILPNSITSMNAYIASNSGVKILELSDSATSYSASAFSSLDLISKIVINNTNAITLLTSCARGLYNLREFIIKGDIYKINNQCFQDNYSCMKYDFSGCTYVPTLANTNAFSNINPNCKIIVPDNLYNDWIATSNWSNFSSYIVKASEA